MTDPSNFTLRRFDLIYSLINSFGAQLITRINRKHINLIFFISVYTNALFVYKVLCDFSEVLWRPSSCQRFLATLEDSLTSVRRFLRSLKVLRSFQLWTMAFIIWNCCWCLHMILSILEDFGIIFVVVLHCGCCCGRIAFAILWRSRDWWDAGILEDALGFFGRGGMNNANELRHLLLNKCQDVDFCLCLCSLVEILFFFCLVFVLFLLPLFVVDILFTFAGVMLIPTRFYWSFDKKRLSCCFNSFGSFILNAAEIFQRWIYSDFFSKVGSEIKRSPVRIALSHPQLSILGGWINWERPFQNPGGSFPQELDCSEIRFRPILSDMLAICGLVWQIFSYSDTQKLIQSQHWRIHKFVDQFYSFIYVSSQFYTSTDGNWRC